MSDRHGEPGMDDVIDLRPYLVILWRRRFLVGAVLLVALSVAAFLNFVVLRPTYESSLILLAAPSSVLERSVQSALSSVHSVETLVAIARTEMVAAQVAKRLPRRNGTPPEVLLGKVGISPIRGTNLLKVTTRDSSPAGAAALASAWAETIVEFTDALMLEETTQALSVLEAKIRTSQHELAAAERVLRDLQAGSKTPILEQRIQEIGRRVALYEVRLAEIEQGGTPVEGEVVLQPRAGTYALTVSSPRSPAQMRKILGALRTDLTSYQAALASEKQRETQLLRRVDLARAIHLLLVQKREELRILLGANKGMVKIVVPAATPAVPVAPRTMLNMILAALLGLTAGSMLAIVMERFRAPAPEAVTHPVAAFAPDPSRHDP